MEGKCASGFPSWVRRGGCATRKMVPFLNGADGVVRNGAKPPYRCSCSAPFQSVRCANIYKVASRHWSTTPPFAEKHANGTPPNLGGEFFAAFFKNVQTPVPSPLFRAFLYFVALSFLVTTFFLARRALLVLLLSAKILGYGGALDAWKGPVARETVIHAGIPMDIYRGGNPVSPILIVHGVNPTGKDNLDLVRISQGLAQAGYEVYVPDLADMKKQHLRPEEAGSVKTIFQFIGRNAAIACFSYGCGPALIAATSPEIRDKVRYAVDFGGYYDIREMLEYVVTGPETPAAYSKWIYLAANSDLAGDENGQEQIKKIAIARAAGLPKDLVLEENLSPGARTLLQIFTATNREEFKAHIDAAPESLQRRLDALSPSRYVRDLRAPLVLIHAAYDPSIPAQQSIELAGAARANGFEPRLTLLQMYGHTYPTLPTLTIGSLMGFYIPETFRFVDVVNHVVASM